MMDSSTVCHTLGITGLSPSANSVFPPSGQALVPARREFCGWLQWGWAWLGSV